MYHNMTHDISNGDIPIDNTLEQETAVNGFSAKD
jgi:hypothetical protein